jgi:hypothetical protein
VSALGFAALTANLRDYERRPAFVDWAWAEGKLGFAALTASLRDTQYALHS